jgi:hypothetical protein
VEREKLEKMVDLLVISMFSLSIREHDVLNEMALMFIVLSL